MHTTSDSIEIVIDNERDDMNEELFDFLLQRYWKKLKQSMRRKWTCFDSVNLWYYKCHKISLNGGGSYIDSPKWLKK